MAAIFGSVEGFVQHLGALRAAGMAGVSDGEQPEFYRGLLLAAASRINSTLRRVGYAVPVDLSLVADEDLREQLTAELALHSYALAAWSMALGIIGAPEGIKLSIEATEKWLAGLLDGSIELLGLPKAGLQTRTGGRVAVVFGSDDAAITARALRIFGRMGSLG